MNSPITDVIHAFRGLYLPAWYRHPHPAAVWVYHFTSSAHTTVVGWFDMHVPTAQQLRARKIALKHAAS